MTDGQATGAPRRLRPAKRAAIEQASVRIFGRLGYARAGIDAIAAEAGVSTRTIYNHFESKLELFAAVLTASAAQVADAFVAEVDAGCTGTDPEVDVLVIARAVASHRRRFPEHFGLVHLLTADADQFPTEIVDRWYQAGPLRVRATIIARLGELEAAGHLRVDDLPAAAQHLVALASSERLAPPGTIAPPSEADLVSAVRVFLHGYVAPAPR